MKKNVMIVALTFVFAISLVVTQAQESLPLGETIIGELSTDTAQVEYTYTATEGEILVMELLAVDFSEFSDLQLIVNDASGVELIRDETFGVASTYVQFTESGDYTIIAAIGEYAAADAAGEYSLRAVTPTELALGEPVTQEKKADEKFYYTYTGDADVNLTFVRDGVLPLNVSVNKFSEYTPGSILSYATLGGDFVTRGALGVIPGGDTYIIVVEENLFSFASDSDTVTFVLGLEESK